jgi:hypothetical protein
MKPNPAKSRIISAQLLGSGTLIGGGNRADGSASGNTGWERLECRVAVERLVPNQRTKIDPLNEGLDANSVKALSWQQDEVNQITQRIDQSEDFGRHTALGLADRLILRPPFAPCP